MTIRLNGSTSGYTQLDSPAVGGNNTLLLPAGNGTANQILRNGATAGSLEFTDKIVSGTAVASTSGTSIDFTGIPSWVKRVTVVLAGVSTNGTSNAPILQLGSSSGVETSGYTGTGSFIGSSTAGASYSSSFILNFGVNAATVTSGVAVLCKLTGNQWALAWNGAYENTAFALCGSGQKTLSGTLDRVRITTVNGTDTFDAGSINILYE